jgi:hypothetical protein
MKKKILKLFLENKAYCVMEFSYNEEESPTDIQERLNKIQKKLDEFGAEFANVQSDTHQINLNCPVDMKDEIEKLMKNIGLTLALVTQGNEERDPKYEGGRIDRGVSSNKFNGTGFMPTQLIGEGPQIS